VTPDQLALARRAVAAPAWRWLPGMRLLVRTSGLRVVAVLPNDDRLLAWEDGGMVGAYALRDMRSAMPDLADAATLGAIAFGLLPSSWALSAEPGHGWGVTWGGVEWVVKPNGAAPMDRAAALVAALEASSA
jgi:hypothetical protein